MVEGILYLVSSFWLGAVHAATPGHGKTIAASYIVGVRGRPVDALVLGATKNGALGAEAVVFHRYSATAAAYSPFKAFQVERNRIWNAVKLLPRFAE